MNIQTNLFDFAFVPAWLEQLDELASMTLPEPWSFVSPSKTSINTHTPILERYINTVFHKQALAYIFAQDAASADRDFYIRKSFHVFTLACLPSATMVFICVLNGINARIHFWSGISRAGQINRRLYCAMYLRCQKDRRMIRKHQRWHFTLNGKSE